MDAKRHEMTAAARNDCETLFECTAEGCDRTMVIDRITGHLTVIDGGDDRALHYGSTGFVSMTAHVEGRRSPASP
jgi:hypothetical protein